MGTTGGMKRVGSPSLGRLAASVLSVAAASVALVGIGAGSAGAAGKTPVTIASVAQCTPPAVENLDFYADSSTCQPNPTFAENGLDVTYKTIGSTSVLISGLEAGSVTFAPVSPSVLFAAVAKGAKLSVVLGNYLIFPNETVCSCTSLSGLDSGPVSESSIGNPPYSSLVAYLKVTGHTSILNKINWVSAGSAADELEYLKGGAAEGGNLIYPTALEALRSNPKLHVLISGDQFQKVLPEFGTVIVATDSYIASHHSAVQALQKAFIEENRKLLSDPSVGESITNKLFPGVYTQSEIADMVKKFDSGIGVNGGLDVSAWKKQGELYNKYFSPSPATDLTTPVSSLLDVKDLRATLKRVGTVKSDIDPGSL